MKIALVSGFLNEHLLPICEELNKRCEFHFIATQDLTQNPQQYKAELTKPYVIKSYIDKQKSEDVVLECDVVIFGGSSSELLSIRKNANKLSFIYTECFFKKGSWRRFIPSTAKILKNQFIRNSQNLYVLCSGSFVSKDLALIGFDTNKCFKFGYFPKVEKLPFEELLEKKNNDKLKFLFVGRLLKLKRAIDTLKCCKKLKDNGIDFELNIIGDGPERDNLKKYVQKHKLDCVNFLGGQTRENVLKYMQQSHLCFINSNRLEGWAAVANESLSQACPVIISDTCGATAYMIKDAYNGFSYTVADVNKLYEKTLQFVKTKNKNTFYENAYNTIWNEWNSEIAAQRFIALTQSLILNQNICTYNDGPISKE